MAIDREELDTIITKIEKTHLLIKKGPAFWFIGGLVGFFISLGVFTYKAALEAASDEATIAKLNEIDIMHKNAQIYLEKIKKNSASVEEIVTNIHEKYESKLSEISDLKHQVNKLDKRYAELKTESSNALKNEVRTLKNSISINGIAKIKFSSGGAVNGMVCESLYETNDPNSWNDNYLCFSRPD